MRWLRRRGEHNEPIVEFHGGTLEEMIGEHIHLAVGIENTKSPTEEQLTQFNEHKTALLNSCEEDLISAIQTLNAVLADAQYIKDHEATHMHMMNLLDILIEKYLMSLESYDDVWNFMDFVCKLSIPLDIIIALADVIYIMFVCVSNEIRNDIENTNKRIKGDLVNVFYHACKRNSNTAKIIKATEHHFEAAINDQVAIVAHLALTYNDFTLNNCKELHNRCKGEFDLILSWFQSNSSHSLETKFIMSTAWRLKPVADDFDSLSAITNQIDEKQNGIELYGSIKALMTEESKNFEELFDSFMLKNCNVNYIGDEYMIDRVIKGIENVFKDDDIGFLRNSETGFIDINAVYKDITIKESSLNAYITESSDHVVVINYMNEAAQMAEVDIFDSNLNTYESASKILENPRASKRAKNNAENTMKRCKDRLLTFLQNGVYSNSKLQTTINKKASKNILASITSFISYVTYKEISNIFEFVTNMEMFHLDETNNVINHMFTKLFYDCILPKIAEAAMMMDEENAENENIETLLNILNVFITKNRYRLTVEIIISLINCNRVWLLNNESTFELLTKDEIHLLILYALVVCVHTKNKIVFDSYKEIIPSLIGACQESDDQNNLQPSDIEFLIIKIAPPMLLPLIYNESGVSELPPGKISANIVTFLHNLFTSDYETLHSYFIKCDNFVNRVYGISWEQFNAEYTESKERNKLRQSNALQQDNNELRQEDELREQIYSTIVEYTDILSTPANLKWSLISTCKNGKLLRDRILFLMMSLTLGQPIPEGFSNYLEFYGITLEDIEQITHIYNCEGDSWLEKSINNCFDQYDETKGAGFIAGARGTVLVAAIIYFALNSGYWARFSLNPAMICIQTKGKIQNALNDSNNSCLNRLYTLLQHCCHFLNNDQTIIYQMFKYGGETKTSLEQFTYPVCEGQGVHGNKAQFAYFGTDIITWSNKPLVIYYVIVVEDEVVEDEVVDVDATYQKIKISVYINIPALIQLNESITHLFDVVFLLSYVKLSLGDGWVVRCFSDTSWLDNGPSFTFANAATAASFIAAFTAGAGKKLLCDYEFHCIRNSTRTTLNEHINSITAEQHELFVLYTSMYWSAKIVETYLNKAFSLYKGTTKNLPKINGSDDMYNALFEPTSSCYIGDVTYTDGNYEHGERRDLLQGESMRVIESETPLPEDDTTVSLLNILADIVVNGLGSQYVFTSYMRPIITIALTENQYLLIDEPFRMHLQFLQEWLNPLIRKIEAEEE